MPASRAAKPASSKSNPFNSHSDSEFTSKPAKTSSSYSVDPGAKSQYKNALHDSGRFENQFVQELESYAAYKAEETTQKVNDCLRLAENIREDATNTLITLHKQGEQINRTHETAANIDQDLSRSETLLGSLGGFFSKSWKPKKTRQIKGPAIITRDDSFKRRANHLEQRDKLGLSSSPRGKSNPQKYSDPTNAMEKVQVEKEKQDNTLSDLSDVLGQLKGMALDMGSEIDRQNKAMDALQDDVDELNSRRIPSEIKNYPWFLKNLPSEMIDNKYQRSMQLADMNTPSQNLEEVMAIIQEAQIPGDALKLAGQVTCLGSLDLDDIDIDQ